MPSSFSGPGLRSTQLGNATVKGYTYTKTPGVCVGPREGWMDERGGEGGACIKWQANESSGNVLAT